MRLNKKAVMDDLFDLLFTVFAGFFLLIFIGVIINGGLDARNNLIAFNLDQTLDLEDFLTAQRAQFEKGAGLESFESAYVKVQKEGYPEPEREISVGDIVG